MAITKDFTASVGNGEGVTFTYILRVTENSTNTANNTSNITVKAILKQSWSGTMFTDWATGVSCTINGSEIFYSYEQRRLSGTSEHVYYTWTGDIAHNSDGSLDLKVGGKCWQNNPTYFISGGITISESDSNKLELTDIPRASSVSVSSSSKKPGESQTITISRASSSFTDTVTWSCGNSSGTIATKSTGTSHSWTVPLSLIKQSPNANQTCTIKTTTYNGSTEVGSKTTTFTVGYYGASTISATSGNTIGSTVTATISRANSNFTHYMWWSFGSKTWQGIGGDLTTSASFTPATATFAPLIPSATSGTLTLILRTYYDGVQVGSDTTKTLTLNLPSSVKPTMGTPTITINNPTVASNWGVAIQGISTVTVAITGASAGTGSTISSYSISGGGFSGTSGSLTTGVLTNTSEYTFTCTITDARGRTSDAKTVKITPVAYSSPTITIKDAYRATKDSSGTITKNNDSKSICVEVEYSYASVSSKNTISRSVSCNNVSNTSFSSGSKVFLESNCDTKTQYIVNASIADALGGTSSSSFKVFTASRAMNINKDKDGIAFGGYATESNVFNSFWTIKQGGVALIDIFYPVGSIYESVNSTNPSTFMGGTWEVFGAGKVTVGYDANDADFNQVKKTGGSKSFNNAHTHTMAHTHTLSHTHTINSHTHTTGGHTLTVNEMPSHSHSNIQTAINGTTYNVSYYNRKDPGSGDSAGIALNGTYSMKTSAAGGGQSHSHGNTGGTSLTTNGASTSTTSAASNSNTGSAQSTQSLLQPYVVTYKWVRTA